MATPKRGRRTGHPDTKSEILQAAREVFFEQGYARASVRSIARSAGVDPALVYHYFGTKRGLFLQLMQMTYDPVAVVSRVLNGDPATIGPRVVATALEAWDSLTWRLVRETFAEDPSMWTTWSAFFSDEVLVHIVPTMSDHRVWRLSGVETQMLGLIAGRYLAKIEPLASMPAPDVVRMIGPVIQHFLRGEPGRDPTRASVSPGIRPEVARLATPER